MTDERDIAQGLLTARNVFSPTSEQRDRVRAALHVRLAGDVVSANSHPLRSARSTLKQLRAAALAKSVALLGIGFTLGYWFAETRVDRNPASAASADSAVTRAVDERATPAASVGQIEHGSASQVLPGRPASAVADGQARADGDARAADNDAVQRRSGRADSAASEAPDASDALETRKMRGASPAHRGRARERANSGSEELALLVRAERAVRAGDGALARSFVAELAARFPQTTWGEERSAILVLAACALDEPDAPSAARDFLRRHSSSVYFDRIQALCGLDAAPAATTETPPPNGWPHVGH